MRVSPYIGDLEEVCVEVVHVHQPDDTHDVRDYLPHIKRCEEEEEEECKAGEPDTRSAWGICTKKHKHTSRYSDL